jgi:hypothetical protein
MLNFIIAGLALLATLAVVLVATWPDVPWDGLQYGGPVVMLLAPVVIFPFSKLLWLAFDLTFRPVKPRGVGVAPGRRGGVLDGRVTGGTRQERSAGRWRSTCTVGAPGRWSRAKSASGRSSRNASALHPADPTRWSHKRPLLAAAHGLTGTRRPWPRSPAERAAVQATRRLRRGCAVPSAVVKTPCTPSGTRGSAQARWRQRRSAASGWR